MFLCKVTVAILCLHLTSSTPVNTSTPGMVPNPVVDNSKKPSAPEVVPDPVVENSKAPVLVTDVWCSTKFGEFVKMCEDVHSDCCHQLEPYRFAPTGSLCPGKEDTECETGLFTESCCKDGREMKSELFEQI